MNKKNRTLYYTDRDLILWSLIGKYEYSFGGVMKYFVVKNVFHSLVMTALSFTAATTHKYMASFLLSSEAYLVRAI